MTASTQESNQTRWQASGFRFEWRKSCPQLQLLMMGPKTSPVSRPASRVPFPALLGQNGLLYGHYFDFISRSMSTNSATRHQGHGSQVHVWERLNRAGQDGKGKGGNGITDTRVFIVPNPPKPRDSPVFASFPPLVHQAAGLTTKVHHRGDPRSMLLLHALNRCLSPHPEPQPASFLATAANY